MNTENAVALRHEDVVFENRNKMYGAYSIRKSYPSNLSKSSGASLLFVGVVLALIQVAVMLKPEIRTIVPKPITCELFDLPAIIPEPQPQQQVHAQPKTNTDLTPVVITKPVDNPLPPVENSTPSSSTGNTEGPSTNSIPSAGNGVPVSIEPVIVAPKTVDFAEVMPEFEGGTKALYKFLRKTLRYPGAARQIGQEGIVYVRFVIDVSGAVTGIEVAKGATAVLDKEASRVISLMPKWKPGSQHGAPVNVRMILPIKFELDKE